MKTKKFTKSEQKDYFYRIISRVTEDFETVNDDIINNGINYDDFNEYQEDINALIDNLGGYKVW